MTYSKIRDRLIRNNDAKHIKEVRRILRANGYLARRVKPQTEAARVRQEGRG